METTKPTNDERRAARRARTRVNRAAYYNAAYVRAGDENLPYGQIEAASNYLRAVGDDLPATDARQLAEAMRDLAVKWDGNVDSQ